MNKKILFSAGGTGGHILPAINLMKHLSEKGYKIMLVTDFRGNIFLKEYPELKSVIINTNTPINKKLFNKILSTLVIFRSILKSIILLYREKPQIVLGFGGYVSFPISLASKFFNLPLLIYENNMAVGKANKYLLPIAKRIFLSKKNLVNYPEKYKSKICSIGDILNKEIINYSINKENKSKDKISILVLGGSQGAKVFGEIIPSVINNLKEKGYEVEVNQQCVKEQEKVIKDFYDKKKIKHNIFTFNKDILKLILSSDLAITRCGASTLAELAFTSTPFIAVPLSNSIDNHQHLNAKHYENEYNCWILEQKNFNQYNLLNLLIEIFNGKKKKKISNNIDKSRSKNAYNDIENEIKKFI